MILTRHYVLRNTLAFALALAFLGCSSTNDTAPSGTADDSASETGEVGETGDASFPETGVDAGVDATIDQDAGPTATLTLTSSAFQAEGTLPMDYTCDGAGSSPPLAWSGAPDGTTEFALLMTTLAKDGLKWNWELYAIPGNVTAIGAAPAGLATR